MAISIKFRKSRVLAGATMVLLASLPASGPAAAQSAQQAWPSAAQRQLVQDRIARFPGETQVRDIDWYQPQERVAGHPSKPFEPVAQPSIGKQALASAQKLVEAKDSYAFLIWRDGRLEHEYYAPGFDRASRYSTASMAKTVVALAMGAAVDQGYIASVDDPIERYIPSMAGTRRGALPIRAYLEMASGIETPSADSPARDAYLQYALGDNIGEAAARWPETCVAQREFCYANANTAMLGWAIEGATGMRYAEWLSQSIWTKLGAADAQLWLDRDNGSPRFSCCLHASAQDWLRIGLLLLNKGKVEDRPIVSATWVERMLAPSPANANYGWQVWRGSPHAPARRYGKSISAVVPAAQPFARDDVYYLDGSAGQRVYVVPSERLVIVRIGAPRIDWDDSELPNLVMAGLQ